MLNSFATCNNAAAAFFIKGYWQTKGQPSHSTETIFPKGEVELIFSFYEAIPFSKPNLQEKNTTPRCFVNGISEEPIYLSIPQRQFFFGVRIHPAAVKALLRVPNGVFANAVTDLELIDKDFTTLWHQLAEAKNFRERIFLMEEWLIKKTDTVTKRESALSLFLDNATIPSSVTQLAATFYYSPRQLQRKAQELFGMPSEALVRYKRYLQAARLLHHSNESLTSVGYECNYFDQAHFIREFKQYTGITPGVYRKQKSDLPLHFFE